MVNDGNGGNNYAVTSMVSTTGVINGFNTTTSLTTFSGSVIYGTTVTFTAIVSAATGIAAPTQGNVDFKDTTTNADLGDGSFVNSSGTSSTWTFTTVAKTFHYTAGDVIQSTYEPGTGFNGSNGTTTQVVNKAPLTITAVAYDKIYDGTTSAAATPTITAGSLVAGDTPAFSETFDTKNVGISKTLTPAGSVDDGNGGNNYAVAFVSNTVGAIGQRAITVTAATDSKVYDGTTSSMATPTITSGSLASHDTAGFSETYDTPNPGTGKTLTPSGIVNDGNSGNNYQVTFVVSTAGAITQTATHFVVGPETVTAGTPFLYIVTALDATGQTVAGYSGTVSLTTSDVGAPFISQGTLLPTSTAITGGVGYFVAILDRVGSGTQTITATDSVNNLTGTGTFTVSAVPTSQFAVSGAPASILTGSPFSLTVTAEDAYGNLTPLYQGTVRFSSSDPRVSGTAYLPANYTFTTGPGGDNGTHAFAGGAMLLTPGAAQTVTATNTVHTGITGTSGTVHAIGLQVQSVAPTATGFTVTFNKPFALGSLRLYNGAGHLQGPPDLLFYSDNFGESLSGSLVVDPSHTSCTFVETTLADQLGGLTDGTYVVSLLSGPNGLTDTAGVPLDASNNTDTIDNQYPPGTTAYTTTFTLNTLTAFDGSGSQVAVSLPAFTQGPSLPVDVQEPHSVPVSYFGGIPATMFRRRQRLDGLVPGDVQHGVVDGERRTGGRDDVGELPASDVYAGCGRGGVGHGNGHVHVRHK